MANIKSQIKRNRQNERQRIRNKSVRSELKTRTKHVLAAVENDTENVDEIFRLTQKRIDQAAAQGVLHKRTAARHKSRLARRANAAR